MVLQTGQRSLITKGTTCRCVFSEQLGGGVAGVGAGEGEGASQALPTVQEDAFEQVDVYEGARKVGPLSIVMAARSRAQGSVGWVGGWLTSLPYLLGAGQFEALEAPIMHIPDYDYEMTTAPDWGLPRKGDPHPGQREALLDMYCLDSHATG